MSLIEAVYGVGAGSTTAHACEVDRDPRRNGRPCVELAIKVVEYPLPNGVMERRHVCAHHHAFILSQVQGSRSPVTQRAQVPALAADTPVHRPNHQPEASTPMPQPTMPRLTPTPTPTPTPPPAGAAAPQPRGKKSTARQPTEAKPCRWCNAPATKADGLCERDLKRRDQMGFAFGTETNTLTTAWNEKMAALAKKRGSAAPKAEAAAPAAASEPAQPSELAPTADGVPPDAQDSNGIYTHTYVMGVDWSADVGKELAAIERFRGKYLCGGGPLAAIAGDRLQNALLPGRPLADVAIDIVQLLVDEVDRLRDSHRSPAPGKLEALHDLMGTLDPYLPPEDHGRSHTWEEALGVVVRLVTAPAQSAPTVLQLSLPEMRKRLEAAEEAANDLVYAEAMADQARQKLSQALALPLGGA